MVEDTQKMLCWTDSTGILVIYNTTGMTRLKNKKCAFWFFLQLLSETFLLLRKIVQDTIMTICMSSYKVPAMTVRFEWTLIFLTDFKKILKYQI